MVGMAGMAWHGGVGRPSGGSRDPTKRDRYKGDSAVRIDSFEL